MADIWDGAVEIAIDRLHPTPWNVNEMADEDFGALVADIEDHGFDEPCQVVIIPEGHEGAGDYWILGGEHRWQAANALCFETVPCVHKTSLESLSVEDLMEWSVKRNNIRGKINAQKFAELEQNLIKRKDETAEEIRARLLIRGERLKGLRKTSAIRENEDEDTNKGGRETRAAREAEETSELTIPSSRYETDGEAESAKTRKSRAALLDDLRSFEQEVLMDCPDTVEHGYLYFGQKGKSHLVVEESKTLYCVVRDMVIACRGDSARVDEFLISAIKRELLSRGNE